MVELTKQELEAIAQHWADNSTNRDDLRDDIEALLDAVDRLSVENKRLRLRQKLFFKAMDRARSINDELLDTLGDADLFVEGHVAEFDTASIVKDVPHWLHPEEWVKWIEERRPPFWMARVAAAAATNSGSPKTTNTTMQSHLRGDCHCPRDALFKGAYNDAR